MRTCRVCNKEKPSDQFEMARSGNLIKTCRECRRAYFKSHNKKRSSYIVNANKARTIENLKKLWAYLETHPCVDCGEKDPVVLEFDHVTGEKKSAISKLVTRTNKWEVVECEIAKCEIRCANCHRRKTAKELNWYAYLSRGVTN